MQFNFNCEAALDCDQNGFSILEGSCHNKIVPGYLIYVKEILDKMGELSSKSQGLSTIITNTSKFFPSDDTLIIKAEKNKVYGYVKVGPKRLFLRDRLFNYHERKTLCVLDFYVYETEQRKGVGKEIFDYMLNFERTYPYLLAYDRPTLRLLSFLKKNYRLDNYITQNNSFIIFDNFFNPDEIPYNDTEFDNETNRVIQNLRTPQYLNTINYQQNNFKTFNSANRLSRGNNLSKSLQNIDLNSRYNNNYNNDANTRINYKNDAYNKNNNYNYNQNDNRQRTMSPIGKQLIYNNDFTNNVVNKDVYKNPNTGFQKYYLNKEDSLAYDNIYSQKKINLINDYMSSKKQNPYEFISEQNGINENSINNSNQRLNELNDKISDIKYNNRYQQDQLYNKRYNYATLFDDKKLVEYNYKQQNLNNNMNNSLTKNDYQNYQMNHIINGQKSPQRLQHYTPFSSLGKVYTTVLPTSSSAYGSYYKNSDIDRKDQSPNKLYY